jgi:hypothetical protein
MMTRTEKAPVDAFSLFIVANTSLCRGRVAA